MSYFSNWLLASFQAEHRETERNMVNFVCSHTPETQSSVISSFVAHFSNSSFDFALSDVQTAQVINLCIDEVWDFRKNN